MKLLLSYNSRIARLLFAAVLALSFGMYVPTRAQDPLPPAHYIPDHDYDTRHVRLDLNVDWQKEHLIGVASIALSPLISNLRTVTFAAAAMTVSSVALENGSRLAYRLDQTTQVLSVELDHPYHPGDALTIVINYETTGMTESARASTGGLVFYKPSAADPDRPKQLWSQGEAEWNHQWFPGYDKPNDFATSEMLITVEKPLLAISNGSLIETKENDDGTRTFHWKIDQPHANYLTSVVVGEFALIEDRSAGVPIITYAPKGEEQEARLTVARVPEMLRFFEAMTGAKFPYSKYGQVFAYGFNGGMENASATTLTDSTIHDARTDLDETSDDILAHELAHTWFGDYLTCRSWSDIWLNESFATYFEALWNEHKYGHEYFLTNDILANQESYLTAWNSGPRRPVVTRNYTDADAIFDDYVYQRGAAVLHMLRVQLGDDDFFRALRLYVSRHAFQPVVTEQFRAALEESTGQGFESFFDQWVYKMGHPIFSVAQKFDEKSKVLSLTVKQLQKIDARQAYPQTELFATPVDIEIVDQAGKASVYRLKLDAKREQVLTISLAAAPKVVNFDSGSTLIKELQFEKSAAELVTQLKYDPDITGRIWSIAQLRKRLEKASKPDKIEIALISSGLIAALAHDTAPSVRSAAADTLSRAIDERMVVDALIVATSGAESLVRSSAIASLSNSHDKGLAVVYKRLLTDQSYSVVSTAAVALGKTGDESAYAALNQLANVDSWHDSLRIAALKGLIALHDPRALDLARRYAAPGNHLPLRAEAITLLAVTGYGKKETFPLVADALDQALELRSALLWNVAATVSVALSVEGTAQACAAMRKRYSESDAVQKISQLELRLRHKQ